ncbi:F-box protein PP2-B1-like [Vitis riparia]|uniref:F-box protein PP2-B1-like n=1 Tax=Vitis riparia TaxID=96939 RepID=UPI00155B351B|nr:F-box protein PP2-B1-like [Vitis riparia]
MESKSIVQATSSNFTVGIEFSALPEGCIAGILAWTSPRDVCRMSAVSLEFLSAAESDALWETFLPADYREIIGLSSESSSHLSISSKKEVFFRLCNSPLLIDGGKKSLWLDKKSGKKCYMLAARDLTITWSDTPMYWTWISPPHSRFIEVANLNQVCWLEIKGKINTAMLSSMTNYVVFLVFQRNDRFYGLKNVPVESSVGMIGGVTTKREIYLDTPQVESSNDPDHDFGERFLQYENVISSMSGNPDPASLEKRIDGWYEVELGEFFSGEGEGKELEISVMEVKSGNWKSGLLIEGIEIRPKFCA